MQTSNAKQKSRSNDPLWYFLAEFSFREFMPNHDRRDKLTAKLLFQAMRELGMPAECIENIEMTLAGFAEEAQMHVEQGRFELPERIRIFCQKKVIDDANSAKTSRLDHAEQTMEHAPIKYHASMKMNGGWGYFLIERGGNVSTGSPVSARNSVDLYLYKEGE